MNPPQFRSINFILPLALLLSLAGGCEQKPTGPVFDVPALIGKRIDAVEAALSTPGTDSAGAAAAAPADMARKSFRKDGYVLHVTYRKSNNKITAFEVVIEDDADALKEEEKTQFLQIANLREDDLRYSVEYIEAAATVFRFIGVRIILRPINHTVIFRITGSEDLLYVTYSVQPVDGAAKTQDFITVPPWETSLMALTGSRISLAATPYGQLSQSSAKSFQMKVQIVVDGKAVCEDSSSGLWARCAAEVEY